MQRLGSRRRLLLAGGASAVVAVSATLWWRAAHPSAPEVDVETIGRRDLVAIVTASGTIEPKRSVNISADTIGRVTRLAVEEGEAVRAGQFLLQIDPEALESAVQKGEAGLRAAREAVNEARVAVEAARASLELARQNVERQRRLYREALVPREALDRAESELKVRESELQAREAEARAAEERLEQEVAGLRNARYNLSKVTIEAPMDGVITSLQIDEGETVLVGTMNNPGTILMTIADLSVIEAELEVDETDVVDLRLGQEATVEIDALPDRSFRGRVTKIGSSARAAGTAMSADERKATTFAVEVTLDEAIPEVRPGFSCTAHIVTARRPGAVAVPIQALTLRTVRLDPEGGVLRGGDGGAAVGAAREEELEGVFVVRDGRATFTPVKIGIAGERYFEVLSGLREGDVVVVGPYETVRELKDGDAVRIREDEAEDG